MITIRSYINQAEAVFAKSLLESVGIPAIVADLHSVGWGTGLSIADGYRLQVPQEEARRALEILDGASEEFAPLPEDFEPPPEAEAEPDPQSLSPDFIRWMLVIGVFFIVLFIAISLLRAPSFYLRPVF